ncbi:hypothetical protein BDW75DRAFT_151127 [Aspergillus navahoensis]
MICYHLPHVGPWRACAACLWLLPITLRSSGTWMPDSGQHAVPQQPGEDGCSCPNPLYLAPSLALELLEARSYSTHPARRAQNRGGTMVPRLLLSPSTRGAILTSPVAATVPHTLCRNQGQVFRGILPRRAGQQKQSCQLPSPETNRLLDEIGAGPSYARATTTLCQRSSSVFPSSRQRPTV